VFDLTARLGVPFSWTGHLEDPVYPLIDAAYDVHVARSLEEMRPFLEDPDATGPEYVYHVYEGLHLKSDEARFRATGLSVDLTIVWPGHLTGEWVKTAGHFHSAVKNEDPRTELVEVVSGQALLLLQAGSRDRIEDLRLVSASAGDWVVIPPGYGHVSMNVGADVLILTVAHSQDIYLEYEDLARHRGAGVWVGPEGIRENPSYPEIPVPKKIAAGDILMSPGHEPLYQMIERQRSQFQFLLDPRQAVPWH
jgi:glucose-6-phosphate isomerase